MKPVTGMSFSLAVSLCAACSNDSKNSPSAKAKVSVASAEVGDMTVELLTDDKLQTGLTPIYVKVATADGKAITDASVTFVPMMTMSSGMQHSAPVIGNPSYETDGLYHGNVVFQMASSDIDTWSATVGINETDADTNEATFANLNVSDSGRAQVFTYTDSVTSVATKYVSSLNFTNSPQVGLNPIIFTLHQMQDATTFSPIEDAALVVDPQMPSMGHGSPGSVNPTGTSLGCYEGKVSFSMAGTWETTVSVSQAGVSLGTPKFTTTF